MKRAPSKLPLRCEILRTLTSVDLTKVVGGDTAQLAETGAVCTDRAFTGAVYTDRAALKPTGG